jgi:ATP-dependent DNA helicase RecG
LRLADITKDAIILQHARGVAAEILDEDPTLGKPVHAALLQEMKREQKSSVNWGRIS